MLYHLKHLVFNQETIRHTKKDENVTHNQEKKSVKETYLVNLDVGFSSYYKNFKAVIINMFKKMKKTMSKNYRKR